MMAVVRSVPFEPQRLEEERKKDKSGTITVRLNKADQDVLKEMQRLFDVAEPSKMLKVCLYEFRNVLHQGFSAKYRAYLMRKDRQRLSDFENLDQKM